MSQTNNRLPSLSYRNYTSYQITGIVPLTDSSIVLDTGTAAMQSEKAESNT